MTERVKLIMYTEEYEKKGLTDDILKKQVRINSIRYKKNIPDETEFIYENFVQ